MRTESLPILELYLIFNGMRKILIKTKKRADSSIEKRASRGNKPAAWLRVFDLLDEFDNAPIESSDPKRSKGYLAREIRSTAARYGLDLRRLNTSITKTLAWAYGMI